jgi:hypothetical protein
MTSHAPVNGIAPGDLPPALKAETVESLQVLRASSLAAQHYPRLDPAQPVLLLGPADAPDMERLQVVLEQAYGPDHPKSWAPIGDNYCQDMRAPDHSRGAPLHRAPSRRVHL